jgi:hypothetical protein
VGESPSRADRIGGRTRLLPLPESGEVAAHEDGGDCKEWREGRVTFLSGDRLIESLRGEKPGRSSEGLRYGARLEERLGCSLGDADVVFKLTGGCGGGFPSRSPGAPIPSLSPPSSHFTSPDACSFASGCGCGFDCECTCSFSTECSSSSFSPRSCLGDESSGKSRAMAAISGRSGAR